MNAVKVQAIVEESPISTLNVSTEANDTRDLARGAGVNYLGYLLRLSARAPFLFLAGLLYGETRFGRYTFAIALVETLAALAVFGLKGSIFKFMEPTFRHRLRASLSDVVASALALALGLSLIFMGALGLVLGTLLYFGQGTELLATLFMLMPVIPFIVMADVLLSATRYRRIMRYEVTARSILEPLMLTLSTLAFYFLGWHEYGLVGAYFVSLMVAGLSSLYFYGRVYSVRALLTTRIHSGLLREIFRFSAPTAMFEAMKFVFTRVDIFIVTLLCPVHLVGIYGMAVQLSTLVKKVRQGFDSMLGPVVAQGLAREDHEQVHAHLATVARWIATVQVPFLLFMLFFGPHVLAFLGKGFASGAWILVFLVAADLINGSLGVSEWPVIFLRPSLNPLLTGATLFLYVGLGTFFVSQWGPAGAALALLVVYMALNGIRMLVNYRMFHISGLRLSYLKPILAGFITGGVIYGFVRFIHLAPVPQILMGTVVLLTIYGMILLLMGLEPEDRYVYERLKRKLRRSVGPMPSFESPIVNQPEPESFVIWHHFDATESSPAPEA